MQKRKFLTLIRQQSEEVELKEENARSWIITRPSCRITKVHDRLAVCNLCVLDRVGMKTAGPDDAALALCATDRRASIC